MQSIQQIVLKKAQVEQFYHDVFVTTQVRDFVDVVKQLPSPVVKVTDVGGGCGFFADALAQRQEFAVEVIDMDPASVESCRDKGVPAKIGDALNPEYTGTEDVVSFNLILHHLVAATDRETEALQKRALAVWQGKARAIFINEYIYDSLVGRSSARIIYQITSSKILSSIGQLVARFVPSLQANTFGTGVRFRSHTEWLALFKSLGFEVIGYCRGPEENISFARRMLLIKSCRRDSYLLEASAPQANPKSGR
jgi:hypothetical protein